MAIIIPFRTLVLFLIKNKFSYKKRRSLKSICRIYTYNVPRGTKNKKGVFIMEKRQDVLMFNDYAERVIYSDFTGTIEHFINHAQKPNANEILLHHLNSQINYISTLLLCYTNIGNNNNLTTTIKEIRRNIDRITVLHPYHNENNIDLIKSLLIQLKKEGGK